MSDYTKLEVWQKAYKLTIEVYRLTQSLPKDELYGLTSQIRRAAVSIAANLAEGSGRGTTKELLQFTRIATGSAYELQVHLSLAHDLSYVNSDHFQTCNRELNEICRMLNAMINSLNRKLDS